MSLQDLVFVHPAIDPLMGCFPLLGEDMVVHHHRFFNLVGGGLDLLTVPLGVHLNTTDLRSMSVPLLLHIVHLKEMDQYGYQEALCPFLVGISTT